MSTILLIGATLIALGWSFRKSKEKTIESLKMALGLFTKTAREIIPILAIVGLLFAIMPDSTIRQLLGGSSMTLSGLFGALLGSIIILPGFVAFPLAGSLYTRGAHLIAVAAFVTTLTMVGLVTIPIEIKHFGKRFALVRNGMSFLVALVIALGMVVIL